MTEGQLFGPLLTDTGVTFRLWAPAVKSVDLVTGGRSLPMPRLDAGWFSLDVPGAGCGTQYQFKIDGDTIIADPASRFQPRDVSGPSEVVDQESYPWRSTAWRGRPWNEATILELHVGTFTETGTFLGAIEKLDHIVAAGITAIELMPVADFPGRWNWGYDGVLLFAPDSAYGRPDDLKALIDAAHERELMVFLDVVYNHFGPEGNYLGRIAPPFFSNEQTPWGGAINYTVPEVRTFAIENAVSWIRDYRFDGLRLDAVHAIATGGTPHILQAISTAVGEVAQASGRHVHLVLENDDNRASLLAPDEDPPKGRYRAQWNDDDHHAWHVLLTGEKTGYYKDYEKPETLIARALAEGFGYQGEPSRHRQGVRRGEVSKAVSPLAFINFLQNHDQIGNRALGGRLTALAQPSALEAALAVLLLSPQPPMLFMGDEWGSQRPFPFFCDFKGDLADAVRKGRKVEFAEAYADPDLSVPDPLAESTVRSAVLDWSEIQTKAGGDRLKLVSALLRARRRHVVPLSPHFIPVRSKAKFVDGVLTAGWQTERRAFHLVANISAVAQPKPDVVVDTLVWDGSRGETMLPWSVWAGVGPV